MPKENYKGIVFAAAKAIRAPSPANVTVRTAKVEIRHDSVVSTSYLVSNRHAHLNQCKRKEATSHGQGHRHL